VRKTIVDSEDLLVPAMLHVISDKTRPLSPQTLHDALVASARGGADVIQIREKKTPAGAVYALCQEMMEATAAMQRAPQIFVNDRVDVAIAAHLHGVHLARLSLPIAAVLELKAQSGWRGLVGVSVHSLDEAKLAEAAGANYVTFGHVFASASHRGEAPRGVTALANVVDALTIPVVAIGGIDVLNVRTVVDTGCAGIAVIGAVLDQDNPEAATFRLKNQMDAAQTKPKVVFPTV